MSKRDKTTDLVGNTLFLGAWVVTSVGAGRSSSVLRYGKVLEYDQKENKVKVGGGSCPKAVWKYPSQTVVLMLIPNEKEKE